jgi:hypothetical protein
MENHISFEDFLDDTAGYNRKYKAHKTDQTIKWNDLQNSLLFATEQKNYALVYVKKCLGYIPEEHIFLPHLSYVQMLLQNKLRGVIPKAQFVDEMLQHMKHIRNDDMKKDGWIQGRTYTHDMRRVYKEFLPEFKELARKRLCSLLGFEPPLKYSLAAELHLRTLFEKDYYRPDLPFCQLDFKAANVVMYRKSYYHFDEATADQSDLFALNFDPFMLDGSGNENKILS